MKARALMWLAAVMLKAMTIAGLIAPRCARCALRCSKGCSGRACGEDSRPVLSPIPTYWRMMGVDHAGAV